MKKDSETPTFSEINRNRDSSLVGWNFPQPNSVCVEQSTHFLDLNRWLNSLPDKSPAAVWLISSVHQQRLSLLLHWLKAHCPQDTVHVLSLKEIPMTFCYDQPEKLGIDRAVSAFAVRQCGVPNEPFLIVDVGTAATIDFVDSQGVFRGGAILPSPYLAIRSLFEQTDQLPKIDWSKELQNSSLYPATNTDDGIRIGVRSSLVGAIFLFYLETVSQILDSTAEKSADRSAATFPLTFPIYLTGQGTMPLHEPLRRLLLSTADLFVNRVVPRATFCPNLLLSALALLAAQKFEELEKK